MITLRTPVLATRVSITHLEPHRLQMDPRPRQATVAESSRRYRLPHQQTAPRRLGTSCSRHPHRIYKIYRIYMCGLLRRRIIRHAGATTYSHGGPVSDGPPLCFPFGRWRAQPTLRCALRFPRQCDVRHQYPASLSACCRSAPAWYSKPGADHNCPGESSSPST